MARKTDGEKAEHKLFVNRRAAAYRARRRAAERAEQDALAQFDATSALKKLVDGAAEALESASSARNRLTREMEARIAELKAATERQIAALDIEGKRQAQRVAERAYFAAREAAVKAALEPYADVDRVFSVVEWAGRVGFDRDSGGLATASASSVGAGRDGS